MQCTWCKYVLVQLNLPAAYLYSGRWLTCYYSQTQGQSGFLVVSNCFVFFCQYSSSLACGMHSFQWITFSYIQRSYVRRSVWCNLTVQESVKQSTYHHATMHQCRRDAILSSEWSTWTTAAYCSQHEYSHGLSQRINMALHRGRWSTCRTSVHSDTADLLAPTALAVQKLASTSTVLGSVHLRAELLCCQCAGIGGRYSVAGKSHQLIS